MIFVAFSVTTSDIGACRAFVSGHYLKLLTLRTRLCFHTHLLIDSTLLALSTSECKLTTRIRSTPNKEIAAHSPRAMNREHPALPKSCLLTLPAEILQIILCHLLLSPLPLARFDKRLRTQEEKVQARGNSRDHFGDWHYHRRKSFNLHPQILSTCTYLYGSGWGILYKRKTWKFDVFYARGFDVSYVVPAKGGSPLCQSDPFGARRPWVGKPWAARPPEMLTTALANMDKFVFDIQLEALDFLHGVGLQNSEGS